MQRRLLRAGRLQVGVSARQQESLDDLLVLVEAGHVQGRVPVLRLGLDVALVLPNQALHDRVLVPPGCHVQQRVPLLVPHVQQVPALRQSQRHQLQVAFADSLHKLVLLYLTHRGALRGASARRGWLFFRGLSFVYVSGKVVRLLPNFPLSF